MLTEELRSFGLEQALSDCYGLRTATGKILEVVVVVQADDVFIGTKITAVMKKSKLRR